MYMNFNCAKLNNLINSLKDLGFIQTKKKVKKLYEDT